ncbi:MAG: NfeD family protein [bacterium]|nr:NfeD family protein [bacterium]
MHLWQILGAIGIALLILEMFTPSMFFLNFALASFICAVISVIYKNIYGLTILFFILSFVSFAFLRPILIKKMDKSTATGVQSKYIGKIVEIEKDVTASDGEINIYGERWDARSDNGDIIHAGSKVKIVRNESIIMYVEKIS